jgi:predicted AlkP superfamily phosphohydrolase/phosphomutase
VPDEYTAADISDDKSILLDTTTGLAEQGYAWVVQIPPGFGPGDCTDAPSASKLILYEDDRELGPSHSSHETIRQIGGGAYSHWNNSLYFSTSDRTDPRTNRRKYRIALGSLKVLVIGLDGTDPHTLRRYIAEGRLPTIAGFFERSREVEVQSEGELFFNSFWPCFATGRSVGSHGVHAFRPLRSGTYQLVESEQRSLPTPFWETAARAGIRTCVLDGQFYSPPAVESGLEKLSCVEWGPHPPTRPPGSLPPNLIEPLLKRYGIHPCPIDLQSLATVQDSADMAALLCIGLRKRAAIINDLIRMTNPELLVAHFPELHTAAHQWLHSETPGHHCYDAALASKIGSPIGQVYEAVDAAIGKVIGQLPADTTVLLACLGGVRVTHGGGYLLHDLLHRLGLSVAPVPGDPKTWRRFPEPVRKALRRCRELWADRQPSEDALLLNLDWSKTRAFSLPWHYDGYVRINQRGREPRGIVAEGPEREQLLVEIEKIVRALRLAGTDEPAAKAVVRAQEEFPGAASAELPDLLVLWNNARPFDAVESAQVGRLENRDPARRSAHNALGGLFAYGPLVAAGPTIGGVRDFDIAPTILKLLDIEVPGRLEGRAISGLIATGPALPDVRNTSLCSTEQQHPSQISAFTAVG